MSESSMNRPSETDWKQVEEMEGEGIDTSDIPPLDDAFFAKAKLRIPKQVTVTVLVDADLWGWFKAEGEEYESLINSALRSYVGGHKEQSR